MCINLTKDSSRLRKNLRRRKKPITCYKVLTEDRRGPFYRGFQWKKGLNVSDRTKTVLDDTEQYITGVNLGFHLYLENPQLKDPCPCPCPCPCPRLYQNPYRCPMVVYKCTVDPKDVVAVGEWNNKQCLVAIRATLVEEVGRLYDENQK